MSDKTYSSEEDFLKYYDSNRFEKLSMTTDILIISIADKPTNNYRKTDNKSMSILLTKRKNYPFKDRWCLPGGFIDVNDDLESCPQKILARETNLKNIYLEQLYTFGNANRDPRTRVVSVAYMALIDKNELNYKLNDNTSWFDIMILEEENIVDVFLDNGSEQLK
ncbi:MAG: NUDIX domain-containing protein, partial [Bacilli bacterium]